MNPHRIRLDSARRSGFISTETYYFVRVIGGDGQPTGTFQTVNLPTPDLDGATWLDLDIPDEVSNAIGGAYLPALIQRCQEVIATSIRREWAA